MFLTSSHMPLELHGWSFGRHTVKDEDVARLSPLGHTHLNCVSCYGIDPRYRELSVRRRLLGPLRLGVRRRLEVARLPGVNERPALLGATSAWVLYSDLGEVKD